MDKRNRPLWYDASIKPVHRGEYEFMCDNWPRPSMRWWSPSRGWLHKDWTTSVCDLMPGAKWRGLTKPARKL